MTMVDKKPKRKRIRSVPTDRKNGRPFTYTKDVFEKLCEDMANGMSIRKACRQPGMPLERTFYDWMLRHPDLAQQYAKARERRADATFDRLEDLIKDALTGKADAFATKVAIDGYKWILARMHRKYSDVKIVEADIQASVVGKGYVTFNPADWDSALAAEGKQPDANADRAVESNPAP